MTTMQIQRRPSVLPFPLLAVLVALLWLALAPPSRHAVQSHGANAWNATRRFGDADPDDDDTFRARCPDGRVYTIRQLSDGRAWDVSVDTVSGANVTRFTTKSRSWVARKLAWCQ